MNKKRRRKITLIKGIDPRASKVDKVKHVFKEFRKRWKDIYWWKIETSHYTLQFYYGIMRGNAGIYVVEENWDNLIILDACRYDVLREVMGEDKDIGYRVSRGSSTLEWVRENFTNRKHDDIVYVTANPWLNRLAADSFHKIISVWKDGWDDNLNTVHPKTMTEYAKKAAKEYPDKRLIIHYMQPHQPYIEKYNLPAIMSVDYVRPKELIGQSERGNYGPLAVWDAYKRSLEATLPHVFALINELKGRTVISADHGELFGKKILFFTFTGHYWGIRVPELVEVPWVVFEGEERKRIEDGGEKERLKGKIRALKELGKT